MPSNYEPGCQVCPLTVTMNIIVILLSILQMDDTNFEIRKLCQCFESEAFSGNISKVFWFQSLLVLENSLFHLCRPAMQSGCFSVGSRATWETINLTFTFTFTCTNKSAWNRSFEAKSDDSHFSENMYSAVPFRSFTTAFRVVPAPGPAQLHGVSPGIACYGHRVD